MRRTATPKGLGLGSAWALSGTAGQAGSARSTPAKRRSRSSWPAAALSARKTQRASRAAIACPSGSSAAGPSPRGNAVSQILRLFAGGLVLRAGAPEAECAIRAGSAKGEDGNRRGASGLARVGLSVTMCRTGGPGEGGGVVVDRQQQAALGPPGDQCVEVGAGGQVVSQRIGREHDTAEYRRSGRSTRPGLEVETHAAPRLAGSQSGPIDPPRLGAGRTVVQTGRDHGQHGTGGRRLSGFGQFGVERRDRAGPPGEPGHPSHAGQVARAHGEPIRVCLARSWNAARGLRAERLAHESIERGVIESGVGCSQQSRPGPQPDQQARARRLARLGGALLCASAWVTRRFMASRTSGWSGWYSGPSGLPWRSTRTSPRRTASGESGRGSPGNAPGPSKPSSSQSESPCRARTRRTISSRSGPVESSSAWPSRARRNRSVGQSFRQDHGRCAAVSQVSHQVLGRGQRVVTPRDRRRRVPGRCGPLRYSPNIRAAVERASDGAASLGKLIELGKAHGPQPDLGFGTAVDEHEHHLGGCSARPAR